MIEIGKEILKKIKLFILYWRRIIFSENHFKYNLYTKLRANIFGGYTTDQWMLYDMNKQKRKEYLSEFDWYRSRYINEPFDSMLNNKIIASEILERYVKVPKIYMIDKDGRRSGCEGEIISVEETIEIIKENEELIFKPYDKGKGNGVNIISYREDSYFINNEITSYEKIKLFIEDWHNWYASETIKQHIYADDLYDKTLNTIRLITMRPTPEEDFKLFFAVQRIGRKSTIPTDNGSRGGIVCNIDIESGMLSYGRTLHDKKIYRTHPDSGKKIEGAIIPKWEIIKSKTLEITKKFPYLDFVAWDVVLTNLDEVCVIEANTSSGVNIIQLWGGQRQGELGKFYKVHGIIK